MNRLVKYVILVVLVSFTIPNFVFSTVLPQGLGLMQNTDILLDYGLLWKYNSMFLPLDAAIDDDAFATDTPQSLLWQLNYLKAFYELYNSLPDSAHTINTIIYPILETKYPFGINRKYDRLALQPQIWMDTFINKRWYIRLFIRATNEAASYENFTGHSRDISRFGFNAAEIDQSVIGYTNNWLNAEFGRTREIWGPFAENGYIISYYSPSYERLALQLKIGRFKIRYFYGFLESIKGNMPEPPIEDVTINRYIVGKGIEYSNHKNLVLGIGEISILSGPYRSIDLAFLNPLAFHLETDLNKRSNETDTSLNNAIWFFNFDWLIKNHLRVSAALVVDEMQLDTQDREEGRPDVFGFWGRIVYTPCFEPVALSLYLEGARLGTYLFQHQNGYCNFVSRDMLLGDPLGNDTEEYNIGIRLAFPFHSLLDIGIGFRRWGDNSLINDPYDNFFGQFLDGPFPSGAVKENLHLKTDLKIYLSHKFLVNISGIIDLKRSGESSELGVGIIGLRYLLPIKFIQY